MSANGCNSATERDERRFEARKRAIVRMERQLFNTFTIYEKDQRLTSDPERWARWTYRCVHHWTRRLIDQRKQHPELEDQFAKLETSSHRAAHKLTETAELKGVRIF